MLYATPPVAKTYPSTTASIESSEATFIPATTLNLDIKCEPTLAVNFDPWQAPNTSNALVHLPTNQPYSLVTSIKAPLSTSITHPPTIENLNVTKSGNMKKPNPDEARLN